ncbi:MAG: hypothetical protein FWF05_04445 [Oscillospiraceae bacterium]|nr:hypothetical protein [Oscillospiraceae bacterium]
MNESNISSPRNGDELPPDQNDNAISSPTDEAERPPVVEVSNKQLKDLEGKSKIKNFNANQRLARRIVVSVVLGFTLLVLSLYLLDHIVVFFCEPTNAASTEVKDLFDTVFPLIQAALFTSLGYLFGDKASSSVNNSDT